MRARLVIGALLASCRVVPNPAFDPADGSDQTGTTGGEADTGAQTSSTGAQASTESSASDGSSSGGPVGPACGDGIVVAGELCFEYRSLTAGWGEDAFSVAAADMDLDADVDMVVGNYGKIEIVRGDGDGGVQGLFVLPTSAMLGSAVSDVLALDLDADAIPDIVAASPDADTVDVMLREEDGSFVPAAPYAVPGRPTRIAAADLDDDDIVDLVAIAEMTGELTPLWGVGDGTFAVGAATAIGSGPNALAVGDIDGNGLVDVVVAAADGLTPMFNLGERQFVTSEVIPLATPITVMLADLDGDDALDMFVSTVSQENFVLFGLPGGGFVEEITWWNWTGRTAFSAAPGDFNADGITDVAWAEGFLGNGGMTFMLGMGDRIFETSLNPLYTYPQDLAVADFDGDGVDDVALANVGSPVALGLLVSTP